MSNFYCFARFILKPFIYFTASLVLSGLQIRDEEIQLKGKKYLYKIKYKSDRPTLLRQTYVTGTTHIYIYFWPYVIVVNLPGVTGCG